MLILLMGSWGAIGITVGTRVPPHRISIMSAVIMAPLMFTGATQYPLVWLDQLRWFRIISGANPLIYVSGGVRMALVPYVPHARPLCCVLALAAFGPVFMVSGLTAFRPRAQK